MLLALVLVGCADTTTSGGIPTVSIQATSRHPFLKDHNRICIIHLDGQEVERFELYPDTGTGSAISNLYRDEANRQLILIDMNGTWYYIATDTGQLTNRKWLWEEPTPSRYLGRFVYNGQDDYVFVEPDEQEESNIYWAKDPAE